MLSCICIKCLQNASHLKTKTSYPKTDQKLPKMFNLRCDAMARTLYTIKLIYIPVLWFIFLEMFTLHPVKQKFSKTLPMPTCHRNVTLSKLSFRSGSVHRNHSIADVKCVYVYIGRPKDIVDFFFCMGCLPWSWNVTVNTSISILVPCILQFQNIYYLIYTCLLRLRYRTIESTTMTSRLCPLIIPRTTAPKRERERKRAEKTKSQQFFVCCSFSVRRG